MSTTIFLSYARGDDEPFVKRLYEDLTAHGYSVWWDRVSMPARRLSFHQEISDSIRARDCLIFVVGPMAANSEYVRQEWLWALELDKQVVPALRLGEYSLVSEELKSIHCEDFRDDQSYDVHFKNLVENLNRPETPLGTLFAVPSLPPHFVARPDCLRKIKDDLLMDLQKPIILKGALARVGIHGMGGSGKSVVAAALTRDREIRRAFPDGIVWLTFGQQPNLLQLQNDLAEVLGQKEHFETITHGKGKLKELLSSKAVLLILDDVWEARHVEVFDVLGVRCRAIVTTRDAGVLHTLGGTMHQVHQFTETEALHLLASAVGVDLATLPPEAYDVVAECGCLPLAVALCGGMAKRGNEWASILLALRQADLERIADRQAFSDQHRSVWRSMQVSVAVLTQDEQRRFAELAVFRPDKTFPEAAVRTLWQYTGNLDDLDCKELLVSLSERSLIQLETSSSTSDRSSERRVSLHDLLHDFASRQAKDPVALHQTILAAYHRLCPDSWCEGPDDGYFFQNLSYHLVESRRTDELDSILSTYDWIHAKVNKGQVSGLLLDYTLALHASGCPDVDKRVVLQSLDSAIRLSAHVLTRDSSQLASQITGRLIGVPIAIVQQILESVCRRQSAPWLRPIAPSLDTPGGALVHVLAGEAKGINAVALTGDGLRAVSASEDGLLRIWDLTSGEMLRALTGHTAEVWSVAVTVDGHRAVSASEDGTLRVWDLKSGEAMHVLKGHRAGVCSVALAKGGHLAVSGSKDRSLRVWDIDRGQALRCIEGHEDGIWSVAVADDGRLAISASWDGTLRLWDLERGEILRTLAGHDGMVYATAITANARLAVSGSLDATLRTWDLQNGQTTSILRGHTDRVWSVALSADGFRAVSASEDRTLRIWDLKAGQHVRTLSGHRSWVKSVALTADGNRAISASSDQTLRVWDLKGLQPLQEVNGHAGSIWSVVLISGGRYAISASEDQTLRVWDADNGRAIRTLEGHKASVRAVAASDDGQRAVSASKDGTLRVWSVADGMTLRVLSGHASGINAVVVTPDGSRALSASNDNTLRLWDMDSGETVRVLQGHAGGVLAVALTPDGRYAVSASDDHTLRVWDLECGRVVHILEGHTDGVLAVTVASGGRFAVSASADQTLRVWDLSSGAQRGVIDSANTADIWSVASPFNDHMFVSASWDQTLRVWDLVSSGNIATFTGPDRMLSCAVASAGGNIVVGDESGTLHFLRLTMPENLARAAD